MKTLRELVVDIPAFANPNADAFRFQTEQGIHTISRSAFRNDVYKLGAYLIDNGIRGAVCIFGTDCYEWAVAHVTVTCGVGIAVGLDKELPASDLIGQIVECGAQTLLYTKAMRSGVEAICASGQGELCCICIDDQLEALRESESYDISSYEKAVPAFDDVVSIFFTSGTTGTTKGILTTHRNMVASILGIDGWSGYGEKDVLLQVLPLHHCYACICCVYLILMTGTVICFCPSLRRIVESIRVFQPNLIHAVPAIFDGLLKFLEASGQTAKGFFGTEFKWLVSGGAALPQEIAEGFNRYGICVYNGYGVTESTSAIIIEDKERLKPGSIGKPISGCEVQIVDSEICVRGDIIFKGYLHDEKATAEVLYDGWFHTGDLGIIDEAGFVTITGRKKNLIILDNGKNVSPEEVEALLQSRIPEIKEVQVYESEQSIIAEIFYTPEEDKFVSKETALEWFNEAVIKVNKTQPRYKQIHKVVLRDEPFPKTSTQKIIRKRAEK